MDFFIGFVPQECSTAVFGKKLETAGEKPLHTVPRVANPFASL
jgi:hypothetical protein